MNEHHLCINNLFLLQYFIGILQTKGMIYRIKILELCMCRGTEKSDHSAFIEQARVTDEATLVEKNTLDLLICWS